MPARRRPCGPSGPSFAGGKGSAPADRDPALRTPSRGPPPGAPAGWVLDGQLPEISPEFLGGFFGGGGGRGPPFGDDTSFFSIAALNQKGRRSFPSRCSIRNKRIRDPKAREPGPRARPPPPFAPVNGVRPVGPPHPLPPPATPLLRGKAVPGKETQPNLNGKMFALDYNVDSDVFPEPSSLRLQKYHHVNLFANPSPPPPVGKVVAPQRPCGRCRRPPPPPPTASAPPCPPPPRSPTRAKDTKPPTKGGG